MCYLIMIGKEVIILAKLLKCYGYCNEKYEKDELIKHTNGKNYCRSCLDKMLKDQTDREELYSTIKELYDVSYPTGFMLRQIKEYKEIKGYTYKSMTLTLRYCVDELGLSFDANMGVGIIPHQYEKAKLDYLKKQKQKDNFIEIDTTPIVVKISKIDNENRLKNEKLIDLEDLIDD